MTIAEWIGTGTIVAAPYLVVGVLWAVFGSAGAEAILWWPALLVSTVCLA